MKQLLWIPLSLSATLISGISLAASITLNCPPHITTEQHVKTLPAGWSAGTDIAYLTPKKEHLLAGVGFYSGPPQEVQYWHRTKPRSAGKMSAISGSWIQRRKNTGLPAAMRKRPCC